MLNRTVFGALMVRLGHADALIDGLTKHYPEAIRPALRIIGFAKGRGSVAGLYAMITQRGDIYLLADATVNIEPTAEDLAEIAILHRRYGAPVSTWSRVWRCCSFSNFGSTRHPLAEKVAQGRRDGQAARAGSDGRWRDAGRYRGDAGDHRARPIRSARSRAGRTC